MQKWLWVGIFLLIGLLYFIAMPQFHFYSPSEKAAENTVPPPPPPPAPAPMPTPETPPAPDAGELDIPDTSLENYLVTLDATSEVKKPGTPGELRVWIGDEQYMPNVAPDAVHDEAIIDATGQASAQVHPFSSGFAFTPAKSICLLLDAGGTVARFKMVPLETGTFNVSADVYLFPSEDCSGTPKPRSATTLSVTVSVDTGKLVINHLKELWTVFWEQALEFWGWLLGLLFLATGAYIRSKLKKKLAEKDVTLPDEDKPDA